jgi:hypothetical protein
VSTSGFQDKVELGGHGTIREDDTVVMRVVLDRPEYRGVDGAAGLHFRGVAFDHYSKGQWTRAAPLDGRSAALSDQWHTTAYPVLDDAGKDTRRNEAQARTGLRQ